MTKSNLTKLGIASSYEISRPVTKPVSKVINTSKDILAILKDSTNYKIVESEIFSKTASKVSVVANV